MDSKKIKIGQTELKNSTQEVSGDFITRDGMEFYKISNFDQMRPFFMSLVSHSDQWLFISSLGGLTAGRKNSDHSLFPYTTDDKIHDDHEKTGSKTIMLVTKPEETYLWEPFSNRYEGIYRIERNLYKNIYGNQLIFEETNHDLGLSFSYGWAFSQQYGIVKKSHLSNQGAKTVKVRLLDGMQNLLPYGISPMMQNDKSTLLDAYKKNELMDNSGLGLFLLSSVPVDKAEPSEALKATTVWQTGLKVNTHLLCANQLKQFRKGHALELEKDIRAERGAYFVESSIELSASEDITWYFVAEINQSSAQVVALNEWIQKEEGLANLIETDIETGTEELIQIVAASDGLQTSSDKNLITRHFANVLFNVMRGGIFDHDYDVPKSDLLTFLKQANPVVAKEQKTFLDILPETINYLELKRLTAQHNNNDLQRLCLEYLPLTFSRRHGDPSRPWNRFSIELADELGKKKFYYQGNWRDIFQNWEALALSYPHYLESMITKFVNASTIDGYNPYRITRDGIDWELVDENDPWSFIGYWGDHQIVYLLKLMELSKAHQPDELTRMLLQKNYAYANVPYRIKGYQELLDNPQDTIVFDHDTQKEVEARVEKLGADGKLVQDQDGIINVNLSEKILVSLLAKLSNYIPEGGIWLNTQRPEWNDANNALVGNGVSMVTLYYIHRFVNFTQSLFADLDVETISVSEEVAELFDAVAQTFAGYQQQLNLPRTNQLRRQIMDELGAAGETYRNKAYQGFSKKQTALSLTSLDDFFTNVLTCTEHTIAANQREDKLYHSYNLMKVEKDGGVSIRYLYEMLEGQVAVLSTEILNPNETIDLLKALKDSSLYRADQHSYILYPDRQLPRFEAKNEIPKAAIMKSPLLQHMVKNGDRRIVEQDIKGDYHFNGNFHNKWDVAKALKKLQTSEYDSLQDQETETILNIFEEIFDHQSFTGRSGTFFGYEGLGSIYWHMVSKLILAVEEKCQSAIANQADSMVIQQLTEHYYDLREGLGTFKTPENYGAFPTDPYSHTPGNAGAQQPGMTGQVKEDILSRFGELGVDVKNGEIIFDPKFLRLSEFIKEVSSFTYIDIRREKYILELSPSSLAFTYCQVPITYHLGEEEKINIHFKDGTKTTIDELKIDRPSSAQLFERTGKITKIEVSFNSSSNRFI
ncbi:MAG: hypothetical protein AB8F94_03420 [Saprospiraceae bacterium]